MAIVTDSWLLDLVLALVSCLIPIYTFFKYRFQHWKKLNVPHAPPTFPFGNVWGVVKGKTMGEAIKDVYNEGKGHPFWGFYMMMTPLLLVRDPELIKTVLVKDFMHFHDRGIFMNERDDPVAAQLVSMNGQKWRNLRAKLSPTFTSGKMKMMFSLLLDCSKELLSVLEEPAKQREVVQVKEYTARFTTDIIATCAFGIQANCMRDPDAIFRTMGRKVAHPTLPKLISIFTQQFAPRIALLLRLTQTPKDVAEFFTGVFRETVEYREKNNIKRNDFLQLLMQLMKTGRLDDIDDRGSEGDATKFSFEEAMAQAYIFFNAGFDTSSNTMQLALYELALNPDIQDRLRAEAQRELEKNKGEFTYESLHGMEYLGRVIDETLRKYPLLFTLQRECTKTYTIPNTDIVLEKGTMIHIAGMGTQKDPEHFQDPEKFDPERFTAEGRTAWHPFAYLPFGEGPRMCIGMRFGLMQTRLGLASLIANFKFEVARETAIPLKYDKQTFLNVPKGGINLRISKV